MPDLALEGTFTHYRLPGLHYWSYVVHLYAFPTGWQPILSTPASLGWSEAPPPTGGNLEGRPQCLFGEHTAGLFHLLLVVAVGLLVLIPHLDLSVTSDESGVEISQM